MSWIRLRLDAQANEIEAITHVFERHGAVSVTFENAGQCESIESDLNTLPDWESQSLSALLSNEIDLTALISELNLLDDFIDRPVQLERVEDRDWESAWRQNFEPVDVGGGLWICPTWCDAPRKAHTVIRLDPGLAFGTGSHPTTRLCLRQMSELFSASAAVDDVLDYGCGSGILAIAAAKLGAPQVWAVDIDPRALVTTTSNAAANDVIDQLRIGLAHDLPREYAADMVIANILADTLIELSSEIASRVNPGGQLLLCGILRDQTDDVCQRYAQDFTFQGYFMDEWCLLAGIKYF